MNAEEKDLLDGGPRVKFRCVWKGEIKEKLQQGDLHIFESVTQKLAEALYIQEKHNLAPVLPDGKVGGNGAVKLKLSIGDVLVVSKSGKLPGVMKSNDFCIVLTFDNITWSCEYLSAEENIMPTSDTPMHYNILNLPMNLSEYPYAALHGHGLASEEDAKKFQIPCSTEETICSTKEDTAALINLTESFPYPHNKIFIRKNHGYYILGKNIDGCLDSLKHEVITHL